MAVFGAGVAIGACANPGDRVTVLNAGSLEAAIEGQGGIGTQFDEATPYQFRGYAAGSTALAHQIKGKLRQGDVFISANPEVNKLLMDESNGGWVDWYLTFARSPLVIVYRPDSRFADAFASMPWYRVLSQSGIRIGYTDPKLDPKGAYTVQALQAAEKVYGVSHLADSIVANARVFPETQLDARLQTGQLDVGFFYAGEAQELGLPTVELGEEIKVGASYTVTVLNGAPNPTGAIAFVRFLLGPAGRGILEQHGFEVLSRPELFGDRRSAPPELLDLLGNQ